MASEKATTTISPVNYRATRIVASFVDAREHVMNHSTIDKNPQQVIKIVWVWAKRRRHEYCLPSLSVDIIRKTFSPEFQDKKSDRKRNKQCKLQYEVVVCYSYQFAFHCLWNLMAQISQQPKSLFGNFSFIRFNQIGKQMMAMSSLSLSLPLSGAWQSLFEIIFRNEIYWIIINKFRKVIESHW